MYRLTTRHSLRLTMCLRQVPQEPSTEFSEAGSVLHKCGLAADCVLLILVNCIVNLGSFCVVECLCLVIVSCPSGLWVLYENCMKFLVLLRIPSSRPNPQTFPSSSKFKSWDFWRPKMTVLKRMFENFFTLFLKFIPLKPRQNGTDAIFTYP